MSFDYWLRASEQRILREEAGASVRLDKDSGVHTCYVGHGCGAESSEEEEDE